MCTHSGICLRKANVISTSVSRTSWPENGVSSHFSEANASLLKQQSDGTSQTGSPVTVAARNTITWNSYCKHHHTQLKLRSCSYRRVMFRLSSHPFIHSDEICHTFERRITIYNLKNARKCMPNIILVFRIVADTE